MSRLDQLPEITDHVLSGLRADDSLKYRIYQKAAEQSGERARKSSRLPLAALCAISAVMIALFVILNPMISRNADGSRDVTAGQMHTILAGGELDESPVSEEKEPEPEPESEEEDPEETPGDEDAGENETGLE